MSGETKSRHSVFSNASDLFSYDKHVLSGDILLQCGESAFEYHEFVSYNVTSDAPKELKDQLRPGDPVHITHKRPIEEIEPARKAFHKAFREGYGLDINGSFCNLPSRDSLLEGRVREVVCFRRKNVKTQDGSLDGLAITPADLNAMDLHPATLQYIRRITTESSFWDRNHEKLSIILSFSANPTTPFDFLSMTYSLKTRTTNVLIRQSYNPRQHGISDLDEYDQRLEACRTHWPHPFVLPVVLLQVQFTRTEEAVAANNKEVLALELAVAGMAGFDPFDTGNRFSRRGSEMNKNDKDYLNIFDSGGAGGGGSGGVQVYQSTTTLMRTAHDTLKHSIKLLDTMKWMERAFTLLLDAGNELEKQTRERTSNTGTYDGSSSGRADNPRDPTTLNDHWHEIREYLETLLRLCMSLETDRRMSENRCRAQIDIIYAKMAQEDNNLNARMAVSATRDSSSMKALAVITAIFLPAEFLGTMFGMSFFEFLPDDDETGAKNGTTTAVSAALALSRKSSGEHVISPLFWIYWATVIPLTALILIIWRVWWVAKDRYFRMHLSPELSQERYWTEDGQPRVLSTTFMHDFFYLSSRQEEKVQDTNVASGPVGLSSSFSFSSNGISFGGRKLTGFNNNDGAMPRANMMQKPGISSDDCYASLGQIQATPTIRLREIAGARKKGNSLLP